MLKEQDFGKVIERMRNRYKYFQTYVPGLCNELNIITITLYLLSFTSVYHYIALIPDNFFSGYFWTIVTSGFCDSNLVWMSIHLSLINLCGRKLSSIWSSYRFLTMCLIIVLATGVCHMFGVYIASKIILFYKMTSPSCTLSMIVAIILIGIRQNFIESKLEPIPLQESTLKIPFKYFLHIYLAGSLLFAMLFDTSVDLRLYESIFFAWIYMRFFMKRELVEIYGDPSRNFSLASFFPEVLGDYIEPISNFCYSQAIDFNLITPLATATTKTMIDKTNIYEKQKVIHGIDSDMVSLITGKDEDSEFEEIKIESAEVEKDQTPSEEPAVTAEEIVIEAEKISVESLPEEIKEISPESQQLFSHDSEIKKQQMI